MLTHKVNFPVLLCVLVACLFCLLWLSCFVFTWVATLYEFHTFAARSVSAVCVHSFAVSCLNELPTWKCPLKRWSPSSKSTCSLKDNMGVLQEWRQLKRRRRLMWSPEPMSNSSYNRLTLTLYTCMQLSCSHESQRTLGIRYERFHLRYMHVVRYASCFDMCMLGTDTPPPS